MDAFTLEITAHRIGGAWAYERTWGPWTVQVPPGTWQRHSVPGRGRSSDQLEVTFERPWVPVRPGLISTSVLLSDACGQVLGPSRAVLVSTLPCDVPMYACFIAPDPDIGVFTLGLRIPQSAWTPEHVETAAMSQAAPAE